MSSRERTKGQRLDADYPVITSDGVVGRARDRLLDRVHAPRLLPVRPMRAPAMKEWFEVLRLWVRYLWHQEARVHDRVARLQPPLRKVEVREEVLSIGPGICPGCFPGGCQKLTVADDRMPVA